MKKHHYLTLLLACWCFTLGCTKSSQPTAKVQVGEHVEEVTEVAQQTAMLESVAATSAPDPKFTSLPAAQANAMFAQGREMVLPDITAPQMISSEVANPALQAPMNPPIPTVGHGLPSFAPGVAFTNEHDPFATQVGIPSNMPLPPTQFPHPPTMPMIGPPNNISLVGPPRDFVAIPTDTLKVHVAEKTPESSE
jgi:hypothetical protein